MEEGKPIRSGAGRAELWLGPSNSLRLSENTLVRMHATGLSHVQIELESGVILMEIGEVSRDRQITLRGVSSNVSISRRGLYRMEHGPAPLLKVFDGRAQVADAEGSATVKRGWMIDLSPSADSEPQKFQRRLRDGFDHWSADRSAYLAEIESNDPQEDSTTLGGGLHPMYVPRTSPTRTENPFPEEGIK